MDRTDNTLKILVTALSILFLLIAIKTSYPADDTMDMILTISGKFLFFELILFVTIYVFGSLLSDATPGIWEYKVKIKNKLRAVLHKESTIQQVQLPEEQNKSTQFVSNDSNTPINFENEDEERSSYEVTTTTPTNITVLSKEIINYVTRTFENIISSDLIEKLLNNFRNLNNGGPYEVIEKKKLDTVLEFDLAHFAWNVCKRIYDKNLCSLIFTVATAEMIKASFPLTLINYEIDTLKQRLRDSTIPTKFRLPIIEIGEELIPFDWQQKN